MDITEEQIQAAALRLCELRGLDPEVRELVYVAGGPTLKKRSEVVASEIRAFVQVGQALGFILDGV